jgi:hypothetical protein
VDTRLSPAYSIADRRSRWAELAADDRSRMVPIECDLRP